MSFVYNDFYGPEQSNREYKEFNLHKIGLPFDIELAERYCESNQYDFDELVRQTILKYILVYIPKYTCAFWNSNIHDGELYFGIDDDGMIKGIPLSIHQTFDKEWISKVIHDTITEYVKHRYNDSFTISITVDIINVEKPVKESGIHPDYKKYLKRKEEYNQEYKEFLQQYANWEQLYKIADMKLIDIVNIPEYRTVLVRYVEESDHRNETVLHKLYDLSYKLPSLSGEEIKDLKIDPSNVFYWVTKLKDELTQQSRRDKPVFYTRNKLRYLPFTLVSNLSDMIPYWVDQINLYVIRIQCGVQPTSEFSYNNGTQWITCNRIIDPVHQQPICMPIQIEM